MSKTIYIINGPNLNLLGTREPEIYGSQSLADIQALCEQAVSEAGFKLNFSQTNIEGEIVDKIQEAGTKGAAIIINPAAYTHTSVALYDAIKAVSVPCIEIHLSQPAARESFRRRSFVSEASMGTISGFGAKSYLLGLQAAFDLLEASA